MLCIALLLGHDALMAVGGMAASPIGSGARHVAMPASVQDFSVGSHGSMPSPGLPAQCHVAWEAVAHSGNSIEARAQTVFRSILTFDLSANHVPAVDCWAEPLWPPGKRRALFQIYRI